MNQLKFYLRTKMQYDIKEQAETYAKIFKGEILKKSFINQQDVENNYQNKSNGDYSYSYVNLVGDLKIMIAYHREENMPTWGYQGDIILSLDSKDDFLEIVNNMSEHKSFNHKYGPQHYDYAGGVTLVKYIDKWGYGWIVEVKS